MEKYFFTGGEIPIMEGNGCEADGMVVLIFPTVETVGYVFLPEPVEGSG
jgi:uncharacterized protein (DUF1330 family)